MPWPTPMHMVQRARLPPVASSWLSAVIISRPPEAPSGWPSAMAPPLGLTFSASSARPSWRSTASAWAAKASLSSIVSKSRNVMPSLAKSFCVAGTGPIPMTRGGTPADTVPRMRARGTSPLALAAASEAMIMAQAPSLMPAALAAVAKCRRQLGQDLHRGVAARVLVRLDDGLGLAGLDADLDDLLGEEAAILGGLAAALAAVGEGVLVGAAD